METSSEETTPNCLDIIQQLYAEGRITDDQKDDLKGKKLCPDTHRYGVRGRLQVTWPTLKVLWSFWNWGTKEPDCQVC